MRLAMLTGVSQDLGSCDGVVGVQRPSAPFNDIGFIVSCGPQHGWRRWASLRAKGAPWYTHQMTSASDSVRDQRSRFFARFDRWKLEALSHREILTRSSNVLLHALDWNGRV